MPDLAIEVSGLGKRYRIGVRDQRPKGFWAASRHALFSPFHYLRSSARRATDRDTIWALKDVSFGLERGGVLGIVGRNGAGKSTLLKLLARITDPTEGSAIIRGRVGALLEVGTGFHPELTGRENAFLNGAILGMPREEVSAKFDQIVDFADMERFVDTRVKYYSSGMRVRLAFAVAAHLEPELLIVDEVLAVGDVGFQKKCLNKMGSVAEEGRTVLLVSHNMEAVNSLCPRALWLEKGRMMDDGPTGQVVQAYMDHCFGEAGECGGLGGEKTAGEGHVIFHSLRLRGPQGEPMERAVCGAPLEVLLDYETKDDNPRNLNAWFWVRDYYGRPLMVFWTQLTNQRFDYLPRQGRLVCRIPKLPLRPGSYLLDISGQLGNHPSDKIYGAAKLEVEPGDFFGTGQPAPRGAAFLCEHSWALEDGPANAAGSGEL